MFRLLVTVTSRRARDSMVVKIYWENGENNGERALRCNILKFLPRLNYTDFIVVQANFRNYRHFVIAAELLRAQRVIVKKRD